MTSRHHPSVLFTLILCGCTLVSCSRETDEGLQKHTVDEARGSERPVAPCGFFEDIGGGGFLAAGDREWADPSTLLTPMLAPWGFDELRAEPANSHHRSEPEWAHHLGAKVRGRTKGSLLAITATDPPRREAAGLLLAVARERIQQRELGLLSHLSLHTVLLAEPRSDGWSDQITGFLIQRPVSLRSVAVTVVVEAGPEGLSTNRDELRPILDELAEQQGVQISDFSDPSTIPAVLDEVGFGLVVLSLDLQPLETCSGSDAARLQRGFDLSAGLLDKLDGALGFDLPDP